MMSAFSNAVSGARVCWMRDDGGIKISVMAIVPESTERASNKSCASRMADVAMKIAEREAGRIGVVMFTGVYMGGEGKGSVNAIGIADVFLTPETERRIMTSGIPQIQ